MLLYIYVIYVHVYYWCAVWLHLLVLIDVSKRPIIHLLLYVIICIKRHQDHVISHVTSALMGEVITTMKMKKLQRISKLTLQRGERSQMREIRHFNIPKVTWCVLVTFNAKHYINVTWCVTTTFNECLLFTSCVLLLKMSFIYVFYYISNEIFHCDWLWFSVTVTVIL